jgi:hypothetical protein
MSGSSEKNCRRGPLRELKHDGRTLARFFFVADPDGYKIEVIQRAVASVNRNQQKRSMEDSHERSRSSQQI